MAIDLAIGFPVYDGWVCLEQMAWLADELQDYTARKPGSRVKMLPVNHRPTNIARNQLAEASVILQCPILMLDADAVPARGTISAFLSIAEMAKDFGAVGAPYQTNEGHVAVWKLEEPVNGRYPEFRQEDAAIKEGMGRVANIGTHTILYSPKVFEKISPPWFEYRWNEKHTQVMSLEDTVFNGKLVDAGFSLWCDWSHWSGHWKPRVIGRPELATNDGMLPDAILHIAGRWLVNTEDGRKRMIELVAEASRL